MARFVSVYLLATLVVVLAIVPAKSRAADQRIIIGGAQSLIPLAEKFSDRFRKNHPGIEIGINAGGSNYAIGAVRKGEIDVGLVARDLDASEKTGFHVQQLGHDAIMLLSYPGNPLDSLTLSEIQRIYLGKINDWNEIGGEAKRIIPLTREKSAALHAAFIQGLFGKKFDGQEKAFTIRASKEKILRTIKRITGAIGYGIVRLEEARNQEVKVLAIDGKLPTQENILQGLYPFARPQYVIISPNSPGIVREWVIGFARLARQEALN